MAANVVMPINADEPLGSLRGLCNLVETLNTPPMTLEAQLLSSSQGVLPYELKVRIAASEGVVLSTRVLLFQAGQEVWRSRNLGSAAVDFTSQLAATAYDVVVRRSGLDNDGYRRLEKSLGAVFVTIAVPRGSGGSGSSGAVAHPTISVLSVLPNQQDNGYNIRIRESGFASSESVSVDGRSIENGVPHEWTFYTSKQADSSGGCSFDEFGVYMAPGIHYEFRGSGAQSGPTSIVTASP